MALTTSINREWVDDNFVNDPMIADGDIIIQSGGDPVRLPAGSDGEALILSGGLPSWQTIPSGFADPMTTRGDLIFRNSSNMTDRLPVGAAGYVVTSDGVDLAWAAPTGGMSDPMTTRGDLIYKDPSGVTTRLPAGTAGQVLVSDGTDIAWGAGGGGSSPWTESAGVIYPTTYASDDVVIGGNSMSGSERLRVVGDIYCDNEINLPTTTSSSIGIINIGSMAFIHGFQDPATEGQNIFIGGAGNFSLSGGGDSFRASRNFGAGFRALYNLTSGFRLVAIGSGALYSETDGFQEVAIGFNSLQYVTGGIGNLAFGEASGRRDITDSNVTSASYSIFIGANTRPATTSPLHEMVIGPSTDGRGNYTFVIGSQNNNTGYFSGDTMVFGIGDGEVTAAEDVFLRGPDIIEGGAGNIEGADFTISPGLGSGIGDPARMIFQTPRVAATGDNLQTRSTILVLDEDAFELTVGSITVNSNTGYSGTLPFSGGVGEVTSLTYTHGILTGYTLGS